MPLYEFHCAKCGHEFEELARGGEIVNCPACGAADAQKKMSCCARRARGGSSGGDCGAAAPSGGGGCGSCMGGNCASCGR